MSGSDTFTRADSSTSMGTAPTGEVWTYFQGTWGIASNQAQVVTTADSDIAVVDAGVTNHQFTATITAGATSFPGVVGRGVDVNNNYLVYADVSEIGLEKRVAGLYTRLATDPSVLANGDILSIDCQGTAIRMLRNGSESGSATDGSLTTGTKVGLRSGGFNPPRWDSASWVTALTGGGFRLTMAGDFVLTMPGDYAMTMGWDPVGSPLKASFFFATV